MLFRSPLDVVIKGVDRAFSRAKREINSLGYCVKAVEEVIEEHKEVRVERPTVQLAPEVETRKYLDEIASKVEALVEKFPEFTPKITSIAESVRVLDTANFRDAEQILLALEDRLIAILKVASEEHVLIEVQKEVDKELSPFRSTMTAEQVSMLEQQLSRRKILEFFNVPRLSLFYLV